MHAISSVSPRRMRSPSELAPRNLISRMHLHPLHPLQVVLLTMEAAATGEELPDESVISTLQSKLVRQRVSILRPLGCPILATPSLPVPLAHPRGRRIETALRSRGWPRTTAATSSPSWPSSGAIASSSPACNLPRPRMHATSSGDAHPEPDRVQGLLWVRPPPPS